MADLGSLLRLKSRVSGVSPYLEPLGKILSSRSFSVVVESVSSVWIELRSLLTVSGGHSQTLAAAHLPCWPRDPCILKPAMAYQILIL